MTTIILTLKRLSNREEKQTKKDRGERNANSEGLCLDPIKKGLEKAADVSTSELVPSPKERKTVRISQSDRSTQKLTMSNDHSKIDEDKIVTNEGVPFEEPGERLPRDKFILEIESQKELIQTHETKVIGSGEEKEESIPEIKKEADENQLTSVNDFKFQTSTDAVYLVSLFLETNLYFLETNVSSIN